MASGNITVNIKLNGPIDIDKITEELKVIIRKEIERVGVNVAKPEPLKVGDYAKVISKAGGNGFQIGEIVKIVAVDVDVKAEHLDGRDFWYLHKKELVCVTDEEIAEATAKLAEKAAIEKWAKIGRKPNEFKIGDAVNYKKAFTTVADIMINGLIAINQSGHASKQIEVRPQDLRLIFPAEAKFE